MSSTLFAKTLAEIEEAVTTVVWRQWGAIGGSTSADRAARAIIDPEALILASLMLPDRSARLRGVLHDWVTLNDGLLSVQRLRNLVRDYPAELHPRLHQFEIAAKTLAQERSAARMADTERPTGATGRRPARAVPVPVDTPANLMLRLRLGMGVGAKADALTVALGTGAPLTVRQIADTTGYTTVSVRTALDDLARAGLLEARGGRGPASFLAAAKQWQALLQLPRLPEWHALHPLFVFAVDLTTWATAASKRSVSDYAFAVRLRDLMETHDRLFDAAPAGGLRQAAPEALAARVTQRLSHVLRAADTAT